MNRTLARCHRTLRSLVTDRRGANLVEYIILVGVVALLSLAAFTAFGGNVQQKIQEEGGKVSGIKTG